VDAWSLLVSAIGLALFLEGLPYFVSPGGTRRVLDQVARLSDGTLRGMGLALMVGGLVLAYVSLH
jgi:uncharacterized protein YjeT (DUF2065 family)